MDKLRKSSAACLEMLSYHCIYICVYIYIYMCLSNILVRSFQYMQTDMPVFKVWNVSRTSKKFIVADSLEEIQKNGQLKLNLNPWTHPSDLSLVLERDGTLVDEDEILDDLKTETFILLEPGDVWRSPSTEPTVLQTAVLHHEDVASTSSSQPAEKLTSPETNHPMSLSPAGDTNTEQPSSKSSKKYTVPLPQLSAYVQECLAAGRILECLNNLISECAHFYINSFDLTSPQQYKEVGEQLFMLYPCIKFPKGTEPWSLFCEKLSQKLRNMRFQRRRKSGEVLQSGKSPKQPKFRRMNMVEVKGYKCISKEDYNKHLSELTEETKKSSPDKSHMQLILRETFKMRREWLSKQPMGSWAPLLKDYPCFEDIDQVIFEYELLRGRSGLEEETKNMAELFTVMEISMEKKPQGSDKQKSLQVIHYMEKSTAFDKGKGKKTETVIAIKQDVAEEDIERRCISKELSPPSLMCFVFDGNVTEFVIIGDGQKIFCHTDDAKKALLYLIILYYITDLDYPRQYSQILGLVQQYVIKEQFTCCVSSKFLRMCKLLEKKMN